MKKIYDRCIKNNKLKKFLNAIKLVNKELDSAQKDLEFAKESFQKENYKWATIKGYYSMFHTGRALLYSKGYREKSHICLISALDVLYDNIIPKNLIKDFLTAKELRENADYENEFSKEGSESIINSAEELIIIAKNI